ncbi:MULTISPECIES: cation-translocating P-type ATPase [Candidatus Accumulibacter]|uniref:Lead, cadmium, zinc and mercury transporting ATPase n=1 Tax=Candidatus Accumulibacter phosphatis TaxID=327160 RepID=A0A5S4EJI3_9PROT|nr:MULTISPECIES: cation-transporting P-type ATPase [Candidatus Accumulibacter]MCM8622737.1 cation-transporting P-type ATPase [Accumulibacter sp.]TMQ75459.1 Lead, cadmium, zinc and mercury transporting ATPase [Candidatus Accumulibacter phosphatis]
MRIHALDAEQALASLNTSAAGIHSSEAARRLAEYGPNHLEEVAHEHLLLRFAQEFTHFFAIILWIGAALAFAAEHFDPGQGMARLGVAIVGVIIINGIFSFWQEYKAERAVAALRQLLPQKVKALRDDEIVEILASELVPGDIVLLEEGDFIAADCRVIDAFGLRVNLSTVTGESLAQARNIEPSAEELPLHAKNIVLAGTSVVSGQGRAVVYATGMRTEFGRIAHLTQTAGETSSPLQREIARLSRIVAGLATGMGVTLFLVGQAIGLPTWENLLFAIGIIVANVPEGLLPTVTLSLAMATQRMARRNALVRHLPAVEALGSTTVICSDKTGTLTQNRMSVHQLWVGGAFLPCADLGMRAHLIDDHRELFVNAALCHNLKEIEEQGRHILHGDPMEIALAEIGRKMAGDLEGFSRLDEIPFDTDRKRMSVLCETPQGRMLYCKGALETVLARCQFIHFDAGLAPLDDAARTRLLAAQDEMAGAGLRVLAFAHRTVSEEGMPEEEQGMVLAGLIGLEDPPRAEVPEAIARCVAAGIRIIMVTGDHPRTALAIARQIGMVRSEQPVVVSGEQLRLMSPTQLQLALDAPEIIFARVAAEQKMRIVEALKNKGEIVAVTGDGVNDAPALKTADIGIAMGIGGTDVAKAAADLILLDDNFASIVAAIEEGRAVFENIRKFLTYILSSNIPELIPYLAFVLFRIPLPLTILQILAVDLGTDMLPALALGAEKPDPAVMTRPPRTRSERLLSWGLIARAYLFLGILEAVAAMGVFFFVLEAGSWHYGDFLDRHQTLYLEATSACLATIVVTQMVNVYLCRHPLHSLLSYGLGGNRYLQIGILAELAVILFILYTPAGNWLFGTAPISGTIWLLATTCAAAMCLLEELRKRWLRQAVQG